MRDKLRHPFWQSAVLLVLAYLIFKFGIAYLPGLIGVKSAPVPSSVVLQYMAVAVVAILLYVSSDERRWSTFKQPIHSVLVDNDKKILRTLLLVAIPVFLGFVAFNRVKPRRSSLSVRGLSVQAGASTAWCAFVAVVPKPSLLEVST